MIIFFGGPIFTLILYFIVLRLAARHYGWAATLLVTVSIPVWAIAFWTGVFPETRILALPSLVIALLLAGAGLMLGHEFPPRKAARIVEKQQRAAEWRHAEEIIWAPPSVPRTASVQEDWAAYAQRSAARGATIRETSDRTDVRDKPSVMGRVPAHGVRP